MNLKRLIIKFKPFIIAFILTINSLTFAEITNPYMLDYEAVYHGFPLPYLTRVLCTFAGRVDYFCFGYIAFLVDFIFWLVVAHFALGFLRTRKLALPRNKLILGILGIIIFALESSWIAFPKLHWICSIPSAFLYNLLFLHNPKSIPPQFYRLSSILTYLLVALVGGTLMIAGFFYILSIVRLGEAKEKGLAEHL